jgi:hypothetical protein
MHGIGSVRPGGLDGIDVGDSIPPAANRPGAVCTRKRAGRGRVWNAVILGSARPRAPTIVAQRVPHASGQSRHAWPHVIGDDSGWSDQ